MKVYILIDTTSNNEILGVYSSEVLAKDDAISYNTPECGKMSDLDKSNLDRMEIKVQTIDERLFNNMEEKETIKLPSFPVYLPKDKYDAFKALCKTKRMPMTKIAEQEIDRFIKRETPPISQPA